MTAEPRAADPVRAIRAGMGRNAVAAASTHPAPGAVVPIPLSGDMIRGRRAVAACPAACPAAGIWRTPVAATDEAVTGAIVSDDGRADRVVDFLSLRADRIAAMGKDRPEPCPAPTDRPGADPVPDGPDTAGPVPA